MNTDYTKLANEWRFVAQKMESVSPTGSLADFLRSENVCDSKDKGGDGYKHYLRFVTKHTASLKAGHGREAAYARTQQALYEGKAAARKNSENPNALVRTKVTGVAEGGLTMMEAGEVSAPKAKAKKSMEGAYKAAIEAAIGKLDGLKGGMTPNIKKAIAEALEGLKAILTPPESETESVAEAEAEAESTGESSESEAE